MKRVTHMSRTQTKLVTGQAMVSMASDGLDTEIPTVADDQVTVRAEILAVTKFTTIIITTVPSTRAPGPMVTRHSQTMFFK